MTRAQASYHRYYGYRYFPLCHYNTDAMTTKTKTCQHYWRCLDSNATTEAICLKCGARRKHNPQYLSFNKQADLSIEARHYRSDNNAEIQIAKEAMR